MATLPHCKAKKHIESLDCHQGLSTRIEIPIVERIESTFNPLALVSPRFNRRMRSQRIALTKIPFDNGSIQLQPIHCGSHQEQNFCSVGTLHVFT